MLSLVEKYITLSGEAPIIGRPVYLIRFSGCNLKCSYCDTPYKDEVNIRLTEAELINDIKNQLKYYQNLVILFTGGEPLLPERVSSLLHLIKSLPRLDFYIETNGSIPLPTKTMANCHYIVDWKAPSSGASMSFATENCKRLKANRDCLKIVVNKSDLEWAKKIITHLKKVNPALPVFLSPQWGSISLEELASFILKFRLPVCLSPQLHKLIWGSDKRGV
jgi:7-carboxy-7-deazaguanine synthase